MIFLMHMIADIVDKDAYYEFACLNNRFLVPSTNFASSVLFIQSISTWFFLFIIWYTYYYIPASMSVLVLSQSVEKLALETGLTFNSGA